MKLLSTVLLTWAGITLGGFALAFAIVIFADAYEKIGLAGVVLNAVLLSGLVALPAGLMLRCRG